MTGASTQVMPVATSSTLRSPLGTPRPGRPPLPVAVRSEREDSETRELQPVVCGYRIGRLVARGGTSVLFEVTHPLLSTDLIMKVVTDPRLQGAVATDAIHAHAKAVAALTSPHVVRTLDAGRLPSGEPFVVMEHLDGEDLEDRLRIRGALPVAEAVRLVMQACEGLAEAHRHGLVHGDLKPGNLIVSRGEHGPESLRIIDFAPAVPNESDPGDPLVTCSPGYAAPEQLGGRTGLDGRADVFALGAILYELVTGRRAFEAATLREMLEAVGRVPPPMRALRPDAGEALEIVVRRCLARDREARFETVLELRDALGAAIAGEGIWAWKSARSAKTTAPARGLRMNAQGRAREPSRLRRTIFLAALGPASALVSMTLVRLIMASSLVAGPPPAPPLLLPPAHPPAEITVTTDLAAR